MKFMYSCGLSKLSTDIQDSIQWCHETRRSIETTKHSETNGLHVDRVQFDNDFVDTSKRMKNERKHSLCNAFNATIFNFTFCETSAKPLLVDDVTNKKRKRKLGILWSA